MDPPPIEESVLGQVGKVMEPAIEPLGFDWRVGIGLVSSLAAREVIVGTLGTIYGIEEADEGSMELQAALQSQLDLGSAVGLLIFFVFAAIEIDKIRPGKNIFKTQGKQSAFLFLVIGAFRLALSLLFSVVGVSTGHVLCRVIQCSV